MKLQNSNLHPDLNVSNVWVRLYIQGFVLTAKALREAERLEMCVSIYKFDQKSNVAIIKIIACACTSSSHIVSVVLITFMSEIEQGTVPVFADIQF